MRSGVSSAARFVGLLAVIADSKIARFFLRKESDFSASSAIFMPPCLDFFQIKSLSPTSNPGVIFVKLYYIIGNNLNNF